MHPRILSIGQCAFDNSQLAQLASTAGAAMDHAASAQDALDILAANPYALVLVNRIFDSTGERGVDFIAALKASGNPTPMMLVSDYQDAQSQAVQNGALPGFGKSKLFDREVIAHIQSVVHPTPSPSPSSTTK